ncbi:MAG: formate--tetrahydrofolate ligase [Chloroflexota bacterium]|nr:MAG: formate--tetrahydrofolate ligase [Chloroflexota bacterium]
MPIEIKHPVPSDIDIAHAAEKLPITEIAKSVGLLEDELELYGKYKAKVKLEVLDRLKDVPNGKYIDVTAITPTPLGEGKTVTTIGLSQGLHYIGKKVFTCIRQPSQGPTFGIKGGAAGGGYAQVVPMEDFNLHLTGDIHAVGAAHNLLAAAIENRMAKEARWSTDFLAKALCPDNEYTDSMRKRLDKLGIKSEKPSDLNDADKERMFRLNIDPDAIQWRRVVDVSDASLRNITIGKGGKGNGLVRESGYDITVASEIMAALAMCTDLADLRERMGRIIIGTSKKGGKMHAGTIEPITAEDLNVAGAMTVLLKDAIKPNLMQTLPGSPAFVHCGPFANIAQGNSSIIADKIALKLADYVVTESGFGADCGMEKFMNLKCRYSGLVPDCVVLVATIRALKMHGGGPKVVAGKPLAKEYTEENLELLEAGLPNLLQHIENATKFGVPVVVAINRFKYDTDAEVELIRKRAKETGAEDAVMHFVWAKGGEGGADLARAVVKAVEKPNNFKFLYDDDMSIKEKIETVAREIYRADGVDYTPEAEAKIKQFTKMGLSHLPLCVAKTHLSFSSDPTLKGTPRGFRMPITDVRASVGAGFIFPLCGTMKTMPGLPTRPVFTDIDIDVETGEVLGLS